MPRKAKVSTAPAPPPPAPPGASPSQLEQWTRQARAWAQDPKALKTWGVEAFLIQAQALHELAISDRTQVGIMAHRSFLEAVSSAMNSAEDLQRDRAREEREAAAKRPH